MAALRVGATFPAQRLGLERLIEALRIALRADVVARARTLGVELRATDGLRLSVNALLGALSRSGSR